MTFQRCMDASCQLCTDPLLCTLGFFALMVAVSVLIAPKPRNKP